MEREDIHGLTSAYALDALDAAEEAAYEEHLRRCGACQRELASFRDVASALAYAVEAPDPPPDLRDRILDTARAERPNVIPFRPRPRWAYPVAAAAAVAATVAVALGAWVFSLSSSLEEERAARANLERATALLGENEAVAIPLSGASGSLVVAETGEAALIVTNLDPAPPGKTYEAWVIEDGQPRPAGLFRAMADVTVFPLEQPVSRGAVVAVTLENAGGVDQPTTRPVLTAKTV